MMKAKVTLRSLLIVTLIMVSSLVLLSWVIPASKQKSEISKPDFPPDTIGMIGDMIMPQTGYGYFGTMPHDLEKYPETGQYYTEFALWVGGIDAAGSVFVISGDGNDMTTQPEWRPEPQSFNAESKESGLLKFTAETAYTDKAAFDGHIPRGFTVKQKSAAYKDGDYMLINFSVTNNGQTVYKNSYIGFKALIRTPGPEGNPFKSKTLFDMTAVNGNPVIRDMNEEKSNAGMFSVIPVSSENVNAAWWGQTDHPITDTERYELLQGTPGKSVSLNPDSYTMLISAGPSDFQPGETKDFAVIIAYGKGESDLELNAGNAMRNLAHVGASPELAKKASSGFAQLPSRFSLSNYPNPFNPSTTIKFDLPADGYVKLVIYDVTGRVVNELVSRQLNSGIHSVTWDGRNSSGTQVTSGVYFARISVENAGQSLYRQTRRLLFLK